MIDGGCTFTSLHQEHYSVVIREFGNHFLHSGLIIWRLHESQSFELCYTFLPTFRQYAGMTFHFEHADFIVQPKYVYFFDIEEKYFCRQLNPSQHRKLSYIGAWQQVHTRLVALSMIFICNNSSCLLLSTAQKTCSTVLWDCR